MIMEGYKNLDIGLSIDDQLFMSSLLDSSKGLIISLSEPATGRQIEICFPPVYSYRNTNESYRLKTLHFIGEELPTLVSIVENSSFLKWFHDESQGIYEENNLKHFMIFTGEEFVDVISHVAPFVSEKP